MKFLLKSICLSFISLFFYSNAYTQSCDWDIEINPASIIPSHCAKSGGLTVTLTGPDAGTLTNVVYSADGLTTISPNSSNVYVEMSAGSYTIKVTAICQGGANDVRTKSVSIPGNYIPPTPPILKIARHALECGTFGRINVESINGSSKPYTLQVIKKQAGITIDTTSYSTSDDNYLIENLTGGDYTIHVIDDCNTATAGVNISVATRELKTILGSLTRGRYARAGNPLPGCNSIGVISSGNYNSTWTGYNNATTPIEFAVQFDGFPAIPADSDYYPMHSRGGSEPAFDINLPPGKTPKDYYGKSGYQKVFIRVKGHPLCGVVMDTLIDIANPSLKITSSGSCSDFRLKFENPDISLGTAICYPVIINVKKVPGSASTNYTLQHKSSVTTGILSSGNYKLTFTTADNYTWDVDHALLASDTDPYTITWFASDGGRNGFLDNMTITRKNGSNIMRGTTIELIGHSDYTYSYTYSMASLKNSHLMEMATGLTGSAPPNLPKSFKPGQYSWLITDSCGSYTLDIDIPDSDVYYYTIDLSNQEKTCGMYLIKPKGTVTYKGLTKNAAFRIIDGPSGFPTSGFGAGSTISLTGGGTYRIMVYATANANPHRVLDEILYEEVVYNPDPLMVNTSNSQGFTCIGAGDNEGQISVKTVGGMGPVKYYLYLIEEDAIKNQNAIDSNLTGDFLPNTGLGMMIDKTYYVKMIDSCGSSAIQPFTILSLNNISMISVNKKEFCEGETLELKGVILPSATYSWVGPHGFVSTEQNPVIANLKPENSGDYYLSIDSPYCYAVSKDTLKVKVHLIPFLQNIPPIVYICKGTTPRPLLSLTPDVDCVIEWFDADGVTPLPGAPILGTSFITTDTFWVQQTSTVSNCKSEKIRVIGKVVDDCLLAIPDHIYVFSCEEVTFDPLANDIILGATQDTSISFGFPSKGTVSSTKPYTYKNTSCTPGYDVFSYTLCIDNASICTLPGEVTVTILSKPEIHIADSCTMKPELSIEPQYAGANYTWEKSEDGVSNWTPLHAANTNPNLNTLEETYYRVAILIPGFNTFYTPVKKLRIQKSDANPKPFYSLWFE